MAGRSLLLVLALLTAAPVAAQAPEASPFPRGRGAAAAALSPAPDSPALVTIAEAAAEESAAEAAVVAAVTEAALAAGRARREAAERRQQPPVPQEPPAADSRLAVARSPMPPARSDSVARRFAEVAARATAPSPTPAVAVPGARTGGPSHAGLCGVPGLQGRELSRIRSQTQGCGISEPVSVTAVQGIPLSMAATLDCQTAAALDRWITREAVPALSGTGGGIAQIRIAAHYTCRPRNNQSGARISEHGRGRAVDIGGFRLRNGEVITVEQHYRRGPYRRALQRMYQGACGIFRTTLGPGSDRFHEDHFHFDLAQHRGGGTYCR